MKYICTGCSYVYDEAMGDVDMGYNAGEKIEGRDIFECPQCGSQKDSFVLLDEEVLEPQDPENLTTMEAEHIPHVTEVTPTSLTFEAGELEFPRSEKHYISSLSVFDEYGDLIEESFYSPEDDAVMDFQYGDFDQFELRATCNQHGTWSSGIISSRDLY